MLDLDDAAFAAACDQLAHAVREYQPDLVVGIATGGEVVARQMVERAAQPPALVAVRIQRPSTGPKAKVQGLLKRLPDWLTAWLRRAEVALRELALRRKAVAEQESIDDRVPPPLEAHHADAVQTARRILLVDDTVDSGRTLNHVLTMFSAAAPAATVRTAVIASTWRRPPLQPDYCLYERTLIRFPWSFDA